MKKYTKEDLISFEADIAELFNSGQLPQVVHLSGGNEENLIDIFEEIKPEDWVFSTWRSHYHALLKGMEPEDLKQRIMAGQSMHLMDAKLKFFASAIVGGCCSIAAGVAYAIKRNKGHERVYCFIGDGALDEGSTYEAIRYVDAWDLPCMFIVENNQLAVDTPLAERFPKPWAWPKCIVEYGYERPWPHCQTGKWVETYSQPMRYM